jgi:L-threonylcarbamoyladenylate synthase
MSQAMTYAHDAPELAIRAMQHFWPGALTVVVRACGADLKSATRAVRAKKDTVGLRLPAHVIPRLVAGELGCALASTSANRSTYPAPLSAEEALADLEGLVPLALDAGRAPLGEESTVVSFATTPPRVLRHGAISLARLQEVLGEVRES